MSTCLDNIVTLGTCDGQSTSGWNLIDAPGISTEMLAKIADIDNGSGYQLAMRKKDLAIRRFRNDFMMVMAQNAVAVDISKQKVPTGNIVQSKGAGIFDGYRGVVIHKAHCEDNIKKVYIESFSFIPKQSGTVRFKISDGVDNYLYDVEVTADQLNTVVLSDITADKKPLKTNSYSVKIMANNKDIEFYDSNITCLKGCYGKLPNECGWADGWNGKSSEKSKGFGIVVTFYCECDYDEVLCQLSDSLVGELIYIGWQIEILNEQLYSGRFNDLVTYKSDEAEMRISELKRDYSIRWNNMVSNFKSLMSRFRSKCTQCKGIKWVSNI